MHRLLSKRRIALIGMIMLTGCVTRAVSPPEQLAINRYWSSGKFGFIYAAYFFTKPQVDDPRWEEKRLQWMETASFCKGGKRVIRRDVRWFTATPTSGQSCAAIVYTVQCDIPTHAVDDNFDTDRRELLEGELGKIEKNCGEKDRKKMPLSDHDITQYKKYQSYLIDRNVCDFRSPDIDAHLQLKPTTRIALDVLIDRALASRFGSHALDDNITRTVKGALSQGLRRANRLQRIFPDDGDLKDNTDNIRIKLALGLNHEGRPHCVQFTARQGNRIWRRTIERKSFSDGRPMYLFDFAKKDDRQLAGDDITTLSEAFRASLGLPDKDGNGKPANVESGNHDGFARNAAHL